MSPQALKQFPNLFSQIPFNRILGLQLDAIEEDHVVLSFAMKNELVGNYLYGILHGGVISSVLDMAGGTAALIGAIQKRSDHSIEELVASLGKSSTVNLHIDFLQPGKGDRFIAKAWVIRSGKKITFTRMELHNQEGSLIAAGSAAYVVG